MTGVAAPPRPHRGPSEASPPAPAGVRAAAAPWPRAARWSLAGAVYLVLGAGLWWHAWTSPSGVMTCDCTDAGRMLWYLEWIPFALGHGHALLHSTYLFHPKGFNLLTDTSVPALGVAASPVTTAFGPVAALNVVSAVIPAATAFTMYWFLLRWVRWAPAAFVGGLVYGFSAWVIVQLTFGWINLACVALLPLVAAAVDEILVRQRRRPAVVGLGLALLVGVEFFVSVEMAMFVVMSVVLVVLLVVIGSWITDRAALRRRRRHAAVGMATAAAGSAVLLAYPAWYLLAGPDHLSGQLWSQNVPGSLGNTVGNLWDPVGHWGSLSAQYLASLAHSGGGYLGPPGPAPTFLGWGLLVVLAFGLLAWRRDRRLWLLAALGVLTFALSLQVGPHHWGPWSLIYHLPVVLNAQQYRLGAVVVLCAAAMLAVIVDRTHSAASAWGDRRTDPAPRPSKADEGRPVAPEPSGAHHGGTGRLLPARLLAVGAAAVVAAVALVTDAQAIAPTVPVTMQAVTVPRWFTTVAPDLPSSTVLATYPFATASWQASIPWQAIAGMPFQMAGGGGPPGTPSRAGPDRQGFDVLLHASAPDTPPPQLGRGELSAVRRALRGWKVTSVVVPDGTGLPGFEIGRGTAYGVAFFTAVLGTEPQRQTGAWVWTGVERTASAPIPLSPAQLATCLTAATAGALAPTVNSTSACVLATSHT